jgi:Carboxypeptidase regulatory-like domain
MSAAEEIVRWIGYLRPMTRAGLAIAIVLWASKVAAQDTTRVRVSGVVFDSIAGSPLANAVVQLVSADNPGVGLHSVQADTLGRYSIDSVPPGRYLIGFDHPILSLLGLDEPTYVLTIGGKDPITVNLATPSAASYFARLCGEGARPDSSGLLLGRLFDAPSRTTVRSGSVIVQWWVASIEHGQLRTAVAELLVAVDTTGRFATCAVPSNRDVTVVGESKGDSTGTVPIRVRPRGVIARDLFVGGGQPVAIDHVDSTFVDSAGVLRPRTITAQVLRGSARLSGVIRTDGGRPLNARVLVEDAGLQARTNDQGAFSLASLPEGTRTVSLRAIGYFPEERAIDFFADSTTRLDVRLHTVRTVLDTIHIFGKTISRDLADFERHRRAGWGSYLTGVEIRRRRAFETTELLWGARSVTPIRGNRGQLMVSSRGRTCFPAVFIDRVRFTIFDDLTELDSMVRPDEIAAMEIYTGMDTPAEFSQGGACAAIVIWRKR